MVSVAEIVAPLFVPATRLDRVAKAEVSGADAIIIDLEDAVAPAEKKAAREALANLTSKLPMIVRINAPGTPWHSADLEAVSKLGLAGIMLPKSEDAKTLADAYEAVKGIEILPLVETAYGIANLPTIASAPGVCRLVFGSVDFSADIGCAHEPESLLLARAQIVLASRVEGLAAPIDGVTLSTDDETTIESDARRASGLGFSGKLCIHPRQISPVLRGFAPSVKETEWATKVLTAPAEGASAVSGIMVDAPVRRRAEQILRRSSLLKRAKE